MTANNFTPNHKRTTMEKPTPNHVGKLAFKFSLLRTSQGDFHFGIIARQVNDFAQNLNGKYRACLVIICFARFILQIGFTIRRPVNLSFPHRDFYV